MAERGSEVSAVVTVRAQPVEVAQILVQSLQSGGNYFEDTQVVPIGPTTIRVTRRFMAQWAIILGIIGLLLCLIGIVAFFSGRPRSSPSTSNPTAPAEAG